MPSLSDKLKAMGVTIGTKDLPSPKKNKKHNLLEEIDGHLVSNQLGEIYVIENIYPVPTENLSNGNNQEIIFPLLDWNKEQETENYDENVFCYLDIETTGLSGGTGTLAFLVGVARYIEGKLILKQFFLHDPAEEPAMLYELDEFIRGTQFIVTFNGKSFDIPILKSRYRIYHTKDPFGNLNHLDLLPIARRLWKNRLQSRTLANIEFHILGNLRTEDDIPGWMIPQVYNDFLRQVDTTQIKQVFYHNAIDVISLSTLLKRISHIILFPHHYEDNEFSDFFAIAKIYEDQGHLEKAELLYIDGINLLSQKNNSKTETEIREALKSLARIYKRQGKYPEAIFHWEKACGFNDIDSYIELAMIYEHKLSDFDEAIKWTNLAIDLLNSSNPIIDADVLNERLEHRLQRLLRKKTKVN